VLYLIGRVLFCSLLRLVFRYSVVGQERVPQNGGVLLVANHASLLDPILLGCATPRPVHFMAKAELFRIPVLSWALPRVYAFPVRRGEADRTAIRTAIEYLARGEAVGIFPEGTRTLTGELLPPRRGAGLIAMRAGVPVVPVALIGTFRPFRIERGIPKINRFIVRFGEPIDLSPYLERESKEAIDEINQRMMEEIKKLMQQEAWTYAV